MKFFVGGEREGLLQYIIFSMVDERLFFLPLHIGYSTFYVEYSTLYTSTKPKS